MSAVRRSPDPPAVVRQGVRELLLSAPAFHGLSPDDRRAMAQALVTVCHAAVALFQEEARSDEMASRSAPLATAQSAGGEFSGVAADRVAGTTRSILNAVSFPRFVTELINGVFKALIDSSQQQMHTYLDLIKNVASSTDGFADANLGPARARQWLVESFPASFELEGAPDQEADASDGDQGPHVRLKDGASPPTESALRGALGLAEDESVSGADPESGLVPLVRRNLARQRQQMLATMVMLGMQRIVVESGRLNAAMRFHIDTRSAAASDQGSTFDEHNVIQAGMNYGIGPWGVDVKMTNTIGYVSTERNQTTEEMNTSLDLNSSVELYFKTDYLPLDRMAGKGQVDRIKVNTLNPDAEAKLAASERQDRAAAAARSDSARSAELDAALKPGGAVAPAASAKPAPADSAKPAPADPSKTAAAPAGGAAPAPAKQATPSKQAPPANQATTPAAAPKAAP